MPQQELFFEQLIGDRCIQVLKTYDSGYAREVFDEMDEETQEILWNSLEIEQNYEPADIPPAFDPQRVDFLWGELLDAAREDVRLNPNLRSFFVVNEIRNHSTRAFYVSADWPSAEQFAHNLMSRRS